MNYRDNLEIDIFDLCKSVLKQWVPMIIGATIGAIILGGYSYYNSETIINADTGEVYTGASLSQFESLRNGMTAGDIALAETTANQYLGYVREYVEQKAYAKDSIYLNLDSQNATKMTSYYSIKELLVTADGGDTDSDEAFRSYGNNIFILSDVSNISNISSAYAMGIRDSETISEIKRVTGLDVDDGTINELISVGVTGRSTFYINCLGTNMEMCKKVMTVLEKRVMELTPSIQENFDFELEHIYDYSGNGKDGGIDSVQRDYNNYLHALRVNMNTLSTIVTAEQKGYYNYLIGIINETFMSDEYLNGDDLDNERINISDIDSVTDLIPKEEVVETVNTKVIRSFDVKFVAIGFVIGAFAVAFIAAVFYVISGKLHTADDLRDAFGVSVVGEITDKNDKLNVITSGISIAASKMNASKIALVGAARDISADELRDTIAKTISAKTDIALCEVCNDVLNSPADMETLADADVAVMVEKKNSSKYENIARELELCNKYGVKVLGAVMMK